MFLVELVMQGVRGFRELARLRFQSGFNLVAAENEAGKTASVDAMMHLLYPSGQAGRLESLVSRQRPDASRAALVVFSDDGTYYRVIQDFSKQAVNLSRYNPATKEFTLMYKDWENTAQFMSGLTAGLSEEEYASLFVFRREHYAGRAVPRGFGMVSASPVSQNKPATLRGGRSAAQDARLAELREALKKAEEAADAEYRLDSAKIELGEITKKLEALEEINERLPAIESNLAALKGCETLPENLAELLDAHEERQTQKMARSDELQHDIESLKLQLEIIPKASLWKDTLFFLGVLAAVGSLVAGLFILTAEYADYFPIGILASLALIVTAWYKSTRKNAQRRIVRKELEAAEAQLAELEKSFEEGGTAIMAYMQATGSSATEELREKADNYRRFLSLRSEIAEQRRQILGGIPVEALLAEHAKKQQKVIELEKAARAVSQHAVDVYSIRQEIERIESESSGSSWDFGSSRPDVPSDFGAVRGEGREAGVFLHELRIASRIGGIEMETLVPAVEAAAQRNFSAVTMGRYVRVEVGHEGEPLVHDKDDQKVNFADLSHSTRDMLYLCLRAGLAEALAGKLRQPFILDDPLAGFDPARQQAACQILRTLGTKTQVILFTSNPALKAEGDAAAELK